MFAPRYLLEIIEEIIADALMQMSALMTSHVVRLARIDEEVWLGACCDASLEEGKAVPWHIRCSSCGIRIVTAPGIWSR